MIALLVFFLGLSIGSFLNVVIDRLPQNKNILRGRSSCDSCKKKLLWFDLVPVFSFINLAGHCRFCKQKINIRNPIVELITGILFVLTFFYLFTSVTFDFIKFAFFLYIISSFIAIFFIDLKQGIIPDKIVYPAILLTFLYLIFYSPNLFANHLFPAVLSFLLFFLILLITGGRGMGFGDVKLSFLLGLFLGFPKIIAGIYLAFLTGAIVSIILIIWRKKAFRGTIAFGPFLVLGGILALFLGERMVSLLLNFW